MTDGDALLATILAEPDEDTPRLMFADWLEEEGRRERAEFIRTQIELARTPERDVVPWNRRVVALQATEKRILALRFAEWVAAMRAAGGPLEGLGTNVQFRRGFVEVAWISASWFVDQAEALFRAVPLRDLRVSMATPTSFAALLASPHLARL
ncbi:MAG TPA: TIGR02996 domain-containing protein, partial [Gemmataceae bacterium]|nr:TIGR02996 domain-containing protein [Gemmataceae bacterium]